MEPSITTAKKYTCKSLLRFRIWKLLLTTESISEGIIK